MRTRAARLRLVAFVLLSLGGIYYASATYLGLVDQLLGRGYRVAVELENSGGLYEGSEVTYRGVPIGNVTELQVTRDGVRAQLDIEEGWQVPDNARAEVHNESAVGEQYVDLVPEESGGPYLAEGSEIPRERTTTPLPEEELLLTMDEFLGSVPRDDLRTVVAELGTAFHGTSPELRRLIDGSNRLVAAAQRNIGPTTRLIKDSERVLLTQKQQAGNIVTLSRELAEFTTAIRKSDGDLRTVLGQGSRASRQVDDLVRRLGPTMPVMLENFTQVNQVTNVNLAGLEQLLVLFPRAIASGFTGTDAQGWGHVVSQYASDPPVCRQGFLPESRWRSPLDTKDGVLHDDVRCLEPLPSVPRGPGHAPDLDGSDRRTGAASRPAPFQLSRGSVVTHSGQRFEVSTWGSRHELFGEEAWRWLLIGPLVRR